MAKPTCIACKGAGGISKTEVQDMIDDSKLIAGDGIIISDENSISLKSWKLITSTDWSGYIKDDLTTADIIIKWANGNDSGGLLEYIPKGVNAGFRIIRATQANEITRLPLYSLLTSSSSVSASTLKLDVTQNQGLVDIKTDSSGTTTVHKRTEEGSNSGVYLYVRE